MTTTGWAVVQLELAWADGLVWPRVDPGPGTWTWEEARAQVQAQLDAAAEGTGHPDVVAAAGAWRDVPADDTVVLGDGPLVYAVVAYGPEGPLEAVRRWCEALAARIRAAGGGPVDVAAPRRQGPR